MFRRLVNTLALLSICGVLLVAMVLITRGIQVRPPGKLEMHITTAVKHHWFVGHRKTRNPLPANAENIAEGRQNFSHYCYVCHGLDGQSTGVPFADAVSPPIPSLAAPDVQAYTDGQLFWVIQNGLWPSGMPAAKGILTDEEMWSIVLYIRHLPPVGSLGEPPAYTGDCATAPDSEP